MLEYIAPLHESFGAIIKNNRGGEEKQTKLKFYKNGLFLGLLVSEVLKEKLFY